MLETEPYNRQSESNQIFLRYCTAVLIINVNRCLYLCIHNITIRGPVNRPLDFSQTFQIISPLRREGRNDSFCNYPRAAQMLCFKNLFPCCSPVLDQSSSPTKWHHFSHWWSCRHSTELLDWSIRICTLAQQWCGIPMRNADSFTSCRIVEVGVAMTAGHAHPLCDRQG